MNLTLTKQMLIDASACDDGVDAFHSMFGDGATVEWTRDKQIELFKTPVGKYIVWAWRVGLIPMWSMRGADLRGVDLQYADLCDFDLQYADLRCANLQYADLRCANLRYANMSNADLSYANMSDADLRGANMSNADLRGADLRWSIPSSLYAELFSSFGWEIHNGVLCKMAAKELACESRA